MMKFKEYLLRFFEEWFGIFSPDNSENAKFIFINNESDVGILMLHGFSSSPSEFKKLAKHLVDKGYNIYVPVIAGHGTRPKDLMKSTPEDWKNSAKEAYFQLKKVSKKIFIIGNSFGSNLALWLAKELEDDKSLKGVATLGAPIFLHYEWILRLRLYTYGFFKRYYKKRKTRNAGPVNHFSYRLLPMKSVRDFFRFIKKETKPNLCKVKIPVFIYHSEKDPIIKLCSANYIFKNIGSELKEIFFLPSSQHTLTDDISNLDFFDKIVAFIKKHQ